MKKNDKTNNDTMDKNKFAALCDAVVTLGLFAMVAIAVGFCALLGWMDDNGWMKHPFFGPAVILLNLIGISTIVVPPIVAALKDKSYRNN